MTARTSTAAVVDLTQERARRRPTPSCDLCERRADGTPCGPHRVAAASDALHQLLDTTRSVLLIDAAAVADVVADALALLDAVTAEALTTDHRDAR